MHCTAVESTTLSTVAYDEQRSLLQLEFRSRAIYEYACVPAVVHEALLRAASKGSYFNQFIRGRFPYRLAGTGPASAEQGPLAPGPRA
jgi:KTSC domain-containing protein